MPVTNQTIIEKAYLEGTSDYQQRLPNPQISGYAAHIAALFYCVLAFSHCAAGIMRGCGRATVPMFVMMQGR